MSMRIRLVDAVTGLSTWLKGSGGAALVSPRIGPGTNPHIIAKTAVDENNVTSHIPAGKSITYISVLCTPSAASAAAAVVVGAAALITQQSLKGIVCIDADSDAFALAATNSGGAIPDSATDGQQFYEIPLGVWTAIPLTAALSKGTNGTGRLDYRCNSLVADMSLDFQFICS